MARYRNAPHSGARNTSGRRSKRMLAVRAMAGSIAWLEGRTHWQDGRILWEDGRQLLAPTNVEVALAQRRIAQIGGYYGTARRAFGDSEAWLERHRELLAQVKWLMGLAAPDLPATARAAASGDRRALTLLAQLLCAEAGCVEPLPLSPAGALLACRQSAAIDALLDVLREPAAPAAGKALAALVLGAIQRRDPERPRPAALPLPDAWAQRAYRFGLREGLSEHPRLAVELLAHDNGEELAAHILRTQPLAGPLVIPAELLLAVLRRGATPAAVVEMLDTLVEAEELVAYFLSYREQLPLLEQNAARRFLEYRHRRALELRAAREDLLATFAQQITSLLSASGEPAIVGLALRFIDRTIKVLQLTPTVTKLITRALKRVLAVPAHIQRPALELLVDYHQRIWPPEHRPGPGKAQVAKIDTWADTAYQQAFLALIKLLIKTENPACIRRALNMGCTIEMWRYHRPHPHHFALVLDVVEACGVAETEWIVRTITNVVNDLPAGPAARALMQPLMQRAKGPNAIGYLLNDLSGSDDLRANLAAIAPYVAALQSYADRGVLDHRLGSIVSGVLALDRYEPYQAHAWLAWLFELIQRRERGEEPTYLSAVSIQLALMLGAAVADGSSATFQRIAETALAHEFAQDSGLWAKGIVALARQPALCEALALLFPQQPQRCVSLLERMGLVMRLGDAVLAQLSPQEHDDLPAEWEPLLDLAPELAEHAARYSHARRGIGADAGPPPGLRRALEQPQRLARELEHLEGLLAERPERADLAARAANLRARLAQPEWEEVAARIEAAERLTQLAAEAQFAHAETQLRACCYARLTNLAGPLPEGFDFDTDLVNATLLLLDIGANRRLLLRLLRAELSGDHGWRERHPANQAFLTRLAAQGIDVETWLSAFPATYACPGVAGGRVNVAFERDPLRILQMGNAFGTCLSVGGANAFSTVANAAELNKRVLYAFDGAGHIVARKLIAINEEGRLVGFHTYCKGADDSAATQALSTIVEQHCLTFAAQCGLELAPYGPIPRLFAQRWYDDGAREWTAASPDPSSARVAERGSGGEGLQNLRAKAADDGDN